jgi:hypothetical protein
MGDGGRRYLRRPGDAPARLLREFWHFRSYLAFLSRKVGMEIRRSSRPKPFPVVRKAMNSIGEKAAELDDFVEDVAIE